MEYLFWVGLLAALVFFKRFYGEQAKYMETLKALEVLLNNGMAIEYKGWHLWKGGKDEYVLLQFDNKSNSLDSTEERFPGTKDGLTDAAAKFVQRTKKGT